MSITRKLGLLVVMVAALVMLRDDSTNSESGHHLALTTALNRHPPSLRVFRGLLELNLVLYCAALSIYVWKKATSPQVVVRLFFMPPPSSQTSVKGNYSLVTMDEDEDDDGGLEEAEMVDFESEADPEDEEEPKDDGAKNQVTSNGQEGSPTRCPEAVAVAGAALDLSLFIFVCLFLFTLSSAEGGKYIDGMPDSSPIQLVARMTAPAFPLLLFAGTLIWALLPWNRRRIFWRIVSLTTEAPFHAVTFR